MAGERPSTPEAVPLHAEVTGSGPALLVLHGLYGQGGNWRRHARRLAERHEVWLIDLRNHGRSPHSPEMTYRAMAADLVALMDRAGHDTATVLGHSMGGKAAMMLALTAPQRVRALIVADIAPVSYEHDQLGIIDAMRAVDLDAIGSRRDAEPALVEAVPEPAVRQFLLTNLERNTHGWRWRLPLETLRGAVRDIEGWPDTDGLYEGPALFVHGARSDYVDERGAAAIRALFPQARIEAVAEAGHFLHIEQPDAFAAALNRFLEDEDAPA